MSCSLNFLKGGLYGGLYQGVFFGVLEGILGRSTLARIWLSKDCIVLLYRVRKK